MRTRTKVPGPEHHALRNELLNVARRYGDKINAEEILAIVAHLCGQLVALQDQRTMTTERAMQLIGKNIEQGNAEVIALMKVTKGNG